MNFDKKREYKQGIEGTELSAIQHGSIWTAALLRTLIPSFRRPFRLHQQRYTKHKLLSMLRLRIHSIWNQHKRHTCPQNFRTLQVRSAHHHFVLRHVYSPFQSQFSKQCHFVKFPVPSRFLKVSQ